MAAVVFMGQFGPSKGSVIAFESPHESGGHARSLDRVEQPGHLQRRHGADSVRTRQRGVTDIVANPL